MLLFDFFSLSLSSFMLFSLGVMMTKYTLNCPCEGHIFAMPGNHLPGHNHIPVVGNYPPVPIIRNAVNPATPIIIQFKSHIHCMPLWRWGRRPGSWSWCPRAPASQWWRTILKQSNQLSFSHPRIISYISSS